MYAKKSNSLKASGFTLIELLIVVAIIGILSSIVLASLSRARARSRDAVRISDMRAIHTALIQYELDHGHIPQTWRYGERNEFDWDNSVEGGFMTFLENGGYLNEVPIDPVNNNPQTSTDRDGDNYYYTFFCSTGSNSFYQDEGVVLRFRSETTGEYVYVSNGSPTDHIENSDERVFEVDTYFRCR